MERLISSKYTYGVWSPAFTVQMDYSLSIEQVLRKGSELRRWGHIHDVFASRYFAIDREQPDGPLDIHLFHPGRKLSTDKVLMESGISFSLAGTWEPIGILELLALALQHPGLAPYCPIAALGSERIWIEEYPVFLRSHLPDHRVHRQVPYVSGLWPGEYDLCELPRERGWGDAFHFGFANRPMR